MAKADSRTAATEAVREVGRELARAARREVGVGAGTGMASEAAPWAVQDEQQRFGDLFNLICDPATLLVAWERVKRNLRSKTAGVDGQTRKRVEQMGVDDVLAKLREELKSGTYRPLPARERLIPKRSGKLRSLGISALRDRIVQTAARLYSSRSSRRTSARPRTDSGPGAEPRTRSSRCGSSSTTHARMSG